MRITMEHAQRLTLTEMREFVASSGSLSFTSAERKQIYGLVERTSHEYLRLSKKSKGAVRHLSGQHQRAQLGEHAGIDEVVAGRIAWRPRRVRRAPRRT